MTNAKTVMKTVIRIGTVDITLVLHHILGNRVGRKQGTYDPTQIFFPVRLFKAIIFKRPLSDLYPYW